MRDQGVPVDVFWDVYIQSNTFFCRDQRASFGVDSASNKNLALQYPGMDSLLVMLREVLEADLIKTPPLTHTARKRLADVGMLRHTLASCMASSARRETSAAYPPWACRRPPSA